MTRGWSRERHAFVQAFEGHELDAANLIMPLVFFVSPTDPRFLQTLDAILRDLAHGSLVHRYDVKASPDGLEGEEGTFSMCTFWLVEALTRAGRLQEARLLFEKMLATSFQWHNYAHTPIGARSDIENVDIDRLQAFYRTYYQPDNAVLLVAGKFDEPKTLALVQKIYGRIHYERILVHANSLDACGGTAITADYRIARFKLERTLGRDLDEEGRGKREEGRNYKGNAK